MNYFRTPSPLSTRLSGKKFRVTPKISEYGRGSTTNFESILKSIKEEWIQISLKEDKGEEVVSEFGDYSSVTKDLKLSKPKKSRSRVNTGNF